MADERQRRGQKRQLRRKTGPRHQLVLRDGGANLDFVAGIADGVEARDAGDVDQHVGHHQPQVEHRHQRLPAGENARGIAVLGQHRHRLVHRIGAHVVERAGLHVASPAISAWMRRGVAGSCTSLTPSASAMALAMQAGTLMQLPSARPLAPSGVSGDGVS